MALNGTVIVEADEDGVQAWDLITESNWDFGLDFQESDSDDSDDDDGVLFTSVASEGPTIVSGTSDDTIRVWDLRSAEGKKTLRGHTDQVDAVAFDGATVVSGSHDETIKVWDVTTGKCKKTLTGHTDLISNQFFLSITIYKTNG